VAATAAEGQSGGVVIGGRTPLRFAPGKRREIQCIERSNWQKGLEAREKSGEKADATGLRQARIDRAARFQHSSGPMEEWTVPGRFAVFAAGGRSPSCARYTIVKIR
jgi:hypothetical protein